MCRYIRHYMKKPDFIEILRDLGLNDYEAKVYLAGLSLGPTTVLKLSQATEIKRTTIYDIAVSLSSKGLMSIQVDGFKKKYVSESPDKLVSLLEERRKRFENALPEFSGLYNLKGGEETIKYYRGIEALKGVKQGRARAT